MGKWGKRVGYGIGDLGCNLVFSTMASYLMVFYTDVFGITAAVAGTMMLVTKFIDAFTDTGMGLIVDRTHTKWGQGRDTSHKEVSLAAFISICNDGWI